MGRGVPRQNCGKMSLKFFKKNCLITSTTASLLSIATVTPAQTNLEEVIQQSALYSDRYSLEEPEDATRKADLGEVCESRRCATAEIPQVDRLRDVSPTDWAYEALRGLVERYNCISGFPEQTYRGSKTLFSLSC